MREVLIFDHRDSVPAVQMEAEIWEVKRRMIREYVTTQAVAKAIEAI